MLYPRSTLKDKAGVSGFIISRDRKDGYVTTKSGSVSRIQTPYIREVGTMTQQGYVPGVSGPLQLSVFNTASWNLKDDPKGVTASDLALQRAWFDFASGVGDAKAAVGTSLAEWRESASMIQNRSTQLIAFAQAIRKGQFGRARNALRIRKDAPRVASVRSRSKDLSAAWLEYWLGIAPLMGDIESAVKVLTGRPPGDFVVGTGTADVKRDVTTSYGSTSERSFAEGVVKWRYAAYLRINNPNVALAQQLGLINVAAIAWELVPLSFVLNWFVPVGKWLDSFSCLAGMDVLYPNKELKWQVTGFDDLRNPNFPYRINRSTYKSVTRGLNIAMPPIVVFDVPTQLSISRAATAVSLLLQTLKG